MKKEEEDRCWERLQEDERTWLRQNGFVPYLEYGDCYVLRDAVYGRFYLSRLYDMTYWDGEIDSHLGHAVSVGPNPWETYERLKSVLLEKAGR